MVDRTAVDKAFGASRDVGIAVHNGYGESPEFEYVVGAFNGTGDASRLSGSVLVDPDTGEGSIRPGKLSNVPGEFHPLAVARVGYNYGGIKGYSEADLEGGPLRFGVAAASLADFDAEGGEDSILRATVDGVLKVAGFSLLAAGFVASEQAGQHFGDRALQGTGLRFHGGYAFCPLLQPVLRYGLVNPHGPRR